MEAAGRTDQGENSTLRVTSGGRATITRRGLGLRTRLAFWRVNDASFLIPFNLGSGDIEFQIWILIQDSRSAIVIDVAIFDYYARSWLACWGC